MSAGPISPATSSRRGTDSSMNATCRRPRRRTGGSRGDLAATSSKGGVMRPVMLATDGSPTADTATDTAIELAQMLDMELVIVTAWDIPLGTYVGVGFGSPLPMNGELARL